MIEQPIVSDIGSAPLAGKVAMVTGASRGFGRAISDVLAAAGADVIGLARSFDEHGADTQVRENTRWTALRADATQPATAQWMLSERRPDILVLNAGASPVTGPLSSQSWESFSTNWNVDTQHVFHWIGEALRLPMPSGSTVIAISSGAALAGSPLSGGYAPAKSAIRFISNYAAEEARRAELGIRFVTLFPQLTPTTSLGANGAAAYAAYDGVSIEEFLDRFRPVLTPEQVGEAVLAVTLDVVSSTREFLVSGRGTRPIES
jgi:NAD(P)-dependent dehydrogenase (short-subunit alcohol dehydrogenase family)